MTATLATVLSALRKPSCSLDVNKVNTTRGAVAKVTIDSTSSGINAAVLSTDANHKIRNPSAPAERPQSSGLEQTNVVSASVLHARIASLKARCDFYKNELEGVRETARSKLRSAELPKRRVSFKPDSHTAGSTKQEQRRLLRSAGSSADSLLPKNANGRKRRDPDLSIIGTDKLKFYQDKGTVARPKVARPKLVRLLGGWRRVGRRWKLRV
jgi:hypothetical protein